MEGVLGIGLRPGEKLRSAGRKIITKAKDRQGFTSFPAGPGEMFRRDPAGTPGGEIPPSSMSVTFEHPMAIVTDEKGMNPYVNFGDNKSKENIKRIVLGWGGRGIRLNPILPGKPGFDEAAAWVLANQEEFDLRPDAVKVKETVSPQGAVAPAENRGTTVAESAARASTRLWDRFRF
jgi:hypothetical protein